MNASFQIPFGGKVMTGFPVNSSASSCTFQRPAKRLLWLPAAAQQQQQQPHVPSSADHQTAAYSKRAQIGEVVKGKLRLGAKILRAGGSMGKVLKHLFTTGRSNDDDDDDDDDQTEPGEKLLKSSHCYLSTTAGPIAGQLFISTHKIAFFSDKPIKLSSPPNQNGEQLITVHYKVVIPVTKINRVNQSEDAKKPSHKYIQIVTVDNFDFWFMGFFNHQKAHMYLQQALISHNS